MDIKQLTIQTFNNNCTFCLHFLNNNKCKYCPCGNCYAKTINSHHVSQLIISDYRANDFVTINHPIDSIEINQPLKQNNKKITIKYITT